MKTNLTCFLTLMFVLLMQISFAQDQTKTIRGTVTDDTGMVIPGVNIMIEGTDQGTASDFNGRYTIEAAVGQVLNFIAVGFESQSVTVGMSDDIDVTMMGGEALEAIMITAFGRKLTRNESTSSVVTVGSEDIEKSPFVDVAQALQGRVSGMTVAATSGTPGSATEIRIRGYNSITAGKSPLYVVDGVPVNSGSVTALSGTSSMDMMSMIGNSNIESVSVLKDASAVAPYGAEGANGVILITTKSGKKGEAKYSLKYTTGFNNNARRGLKMMNGEQKLEAAQLGFINGGYADNMDDAYDFIDANFADLGAWDAQGRPDIDWHELVKNKDALMMDANFSVSQGTEKSNFFATLGVNKTEGTVIASEYKRVTGNLKYNTQLNDKMDLQVSANVANADQEGVLEIEGSDGSNAYYSNPNMTPYFMSPWANPYLPDGSLSIGNEWNLANNGLHNPLYTAPKNIRNNNVTRAIQNTNFTYDILDNLTFRSVMGIDYTLAYGKTYTNPIHGDGESPNGYVQEASTRLFKYTTQNTLDYHFTLGEVHNFNLTAVQEFSKYKTNQLSGYGDNMANEILNNISAASANYDASSSFSDRMNQRYVGLLSYNFDKKYLLDASYSYQGDSRFSEQFGNFYSVGLGWNLHEENFLIDSDVVNELRLRGGYGLTGNANISRNRFQSLLGFGSYRENPAGIITEYGTTATWEKSLRMDAALEFAMFNRRLMGSVGYYSNETQDMLFSVPLPHSSLYTGGRVLQNGGEMTNRGFEVELSGDIISTPDFNWNLGGNFSTLTNEITSLPDDSETLEGIWALAEDHMVYEWRMKEWAGIDSENGDALWYINRETNGNETTTDYTEAEKVYQGSSRLPKYSGSINTRFDYRNFFLEGQLYFAGGHKVWEAWSSYLQTTNVNSVLQVANSSQAAFEGAWRQPGDDATYPRFDYGSTNVDDASSASTRFLHDGDYMRLRDVGIGYTFDRDALQGTFLDGLTLSIRGTNLWTWVKDSSLEHDPEVEADSGFTDLTTPPIKSVTFNVNLNF